MARVQMQPQLYCGTQSCYYVHPQIQAKIHSAPPAGDGPVPLVLVHADDGAVHPDALRKLVGRFADFDDVFSEDFLRDALLVQSATPLRTSADELGPMDMASGLWNVSSLLLLEQGGRHLLPGPYFLCGFSTCVVPRDTSLTDSDPIFDPVPYMDQSGIWKNVALPSRCYSQQSVERPLASVRIAIKDCYTFMASRPCSRARPFEETYGPDESSATFIQFLIHAGAVIVGKTRASAFLSSEEPTDQWIDFHAPFSPRGDGYQTPAGSSNGAAAALSGYQWLDLSIGTDTSGSIRYPAVLCGLHALRLTTHTVPMQGIWPGCRELDAIGLLSRDLQSLQGITSMIVKSQSGRIDETKFPAKILYPLDFFPYSDKQMQTMTNESIALLEGHLKVKKLSLSISERWTRCPPDEAGEKSLGEFLAKVGYYPFYYDGYHEYSQFRADYRKKFDKEPYVGPYMQWKWDAGSKSTLEQKKQALQDMKIYREWFAKSVMGPHPEPDSDAVLVMPIDTPAPDYRDKPYGPPGALSGFSECYLASILGLPQLVVTVGQVPYDSRASGRTEYHPVTVSLVGARGSENILAKLARETLENAGWSHRLLTGRYTFEVGNNTRHVRELVPDESPWHS